jgi:hypothetical protein
MDDSFVVAGLKRGDALLCLLSFLNWVRVSTEGPVTLIGTDLPLFGWV